MSEGWVADTIGFSSPRDEMVQRLPQVTPMGALGNQVPVLQGIDRPALLCR